MQPVFESVQKILVALVTFFFISQLLIFNCERSCTRSLVKFTIFFTIWKPRHNLVFEGFKLCGIVCWNRLQSSYEDRITLASVWFRHWCHHGSGDQSHRTQWLYEWNWAEPLQSLINYMGRLMRCVMWGSGKAWGYLEMHLRRENRGHDQWVHQQQRPGGAHGKSRGSQYLKWTLFKEKYFLSLKCAKCISLQ